MPRVSKCRTSLCFHSIQSAGHCEAPDDAGTSAASSDATAGCAHLPIYQGKGASAHRKKKLSKSSSCVVALFLEMLLQEPCREADGGRGRRMVLWRAGLVDRIEMCAFQSAITSTKTIRKT